MEVISVILIEGWELDPENFGQLTGHDLACACFRCGKRIGIHIGQIALAGLMHQDQAAIILACPSCREEAQGLRVPGEGAELKLPPIEFRLGHSPADKKKGGQT